MMKNFSFPDRKCPAFADAFSIESGSTLGTYSPFEEGEIETETRFPAFRISHWVVVDGRPGKKSVSIGYSDSFPAIVKDKTGFLGFDRDVFLSPREAPLRSFIPGEDDPEGHRIAAEVVEAHRKARRIWYAPREPASAEEIVIEIAMGPRAAARHGYKDAVMAAPPSPDRIYAIPVAVDLAELSPAARWLAEHLVLSHGQNHIKAISRFTMRDRDIAGGVDRRYIERVSACYGKFYTAEKMWYRVTLPEWGSCFKRPSELLESVVVRAKRENVAYFVDELGHRFDL